MGGGSVLHPASNPTPKPINKNLIVLTKPFSHPKLGELVPGPRPYLQFAAAIAATILSITSRSSLVPGR